MNKKLKYEDLDKIELEDCLVYSFEWQKNFTNFTLKFKHINANVKGKFIFLNAKKVKMNIEFDNERFIEPHDIIKKEQNWKIIFLSPKGTIELLADDLNIHYDS